MCLVGLERVILNRGSTVARGSRPGPVHAPAREHRGGDEERQEAGRRTRFRIRLTCPDEANRVHRAVAAPSPCRVRRSEILGDDVALWSLSTGDRLLPDPRLGRARIRGYRQEVGGRLAEPRISDTGQGVARSRCPGCSNPSGRRCRPPTEHPPGWVWDSRSCAISSSYTEGHSSRIAGESARVLRCGSPSRARPSETIQPDGRDGSTRRVSADATGWSRS